MYFLKTTTVFLFLMLATSAHADVLVSWGDGLYGTDFTWNEPQGKITIVNGDDNDYKFYVETSEGSGVEGVINNITVDPNAVGDFTVLIDRSGADPGAAQWKAGNLTHPVPASTATLSGVILSGDIGASGNVTIEELDGPFTVVNLKNTVTITSVTSAALGTDPISVTNDLEGTLDIDDPNLARDIHVGNDLSGALDLAGNLRANLEVEQQLTGDIVIAGNIKDVGDNHFWIRQMVNGYVSCVDMELKGEQLSDDTWRSALPA